MFVGLVDASFFFAARERVRTEQIRCIGGDESALHVGQRSSQCSRPSEPCTRGEAGVCSGAGGRRCSSQRGVVCASLMYLCWV